MLYGCCFFSFPWNALVKHFPLWVSCVGCLLVRCSSLKSYCILHASGDWSQCALWRWCIPCPVRGKKEKMKNRLKGAVAVFRKGGQWPQTSWEQSDRTGIWGGDISHWGPFESPTYQDFAKGERFRLETSGAGGIVYTAVFRCSQLKRFWCFSVL